MQVVQDAYRGSDLPRGAVVTIGNFDGLHRGQREVITTVLDRAEALDAPSVVITFEPHPLTVLRPSEAPPRLTTLEQKLELLESVGVDTALVVRFDHELSRTSARDFVRHLLVDGLAAREVHVGDDFRFGRDRDGTVAGLQDLGSELGFTAHAIDEVVSRGERVSSTRIRLALQEGRVESALRMLERPHSITGKVVRGDRMGKRLGWPTINVATDGQLLPAGGVYACEVRIASLPATFLGSTNIGTRPTVYENYQQVVETHILDFSSDVYGERAEILFYKRLRDERIFPTVMDLSAQIGRDVEATREFFAARRGLAQQMEQ
ncbi:MAG: bifunctional riboflavin kinase/FAD synthetase [Acidobacteriota bacterium]